MKNRWTGISIDLEVLGHRIEDFFRNRGLRTYSESVSNEYRVVAEDTIEGKRIFSYVKISGTSADFAVEFSTNRAGRLSVFLSPLVTMFGGGLLILDSLKFQGYYEMLEKEFWNFLEDAVRGMRG